MVTTAKYMPHSAADSTCDVAIDPANQNQYIVWAVGGLGQTAFKHFTRAERKLRVYWFSLFVCFVCSVVPKVRHLELLKNEGRASYMCVLQETKGWWVNCRGGHMRVCMK